MEIDAADLLKLSDSPSLSPALDGKEFSGVSTDSRTTTRGEIFFALKGEQFDGHRFVGDALEKGAAVAVVETSSTVAGRSDLPLIRVDDTTKALGALAGTYRRKFSIPVLAIGGSNGKTTTKEMIAIVLGSTYRVVSTEGNLNNHIGVPLTLFRLRREHEIAVVEVGTNHPGEMASLCAILDPSHGLVTTIGKEHLEFLKSVDGVAEEEGSLYRYIRGRKRAGAFVNADDPLVESQAKGLKNVWRYGFSRKRVRVRGTLISGDAKGCSRFQFLRHGGKRSTSVQLQIPGDHHATNALAATTVGLTFEITSGQIRKALQHFKPTSKRMEILQCGEAIIYNDTYNANPDSMLAALATLARVKTTGKKIAVLASMRELGDQSAVEHAAIGRQIEKLGITYLLTYGEEARPIHENARISDKFHYEQKNVLAEYLAELLSPGDVVLVKGSRSMRMEDVVTFILERHRASRNRQLEAS